MDLSRLRTGERLAGFGGLALLLIMFIFDWYGAKGVSGGADAWESYSLIDLILFVTALAGIGLAILQGTQRRLDLPVAASVVVTILGVLSVLLILFRIIDTPDFGATSVNVPGVGEVDTGLEVTRKIGVFFGLIASAAVALGGYMSMQDEGTSFGEARDQLSGTVSGGSGGPGGGPPPPGGPSGGPPPPPPPPGQ